MRFRSLSMLLAALATMANVQAQPSHVVCYDDLFVPYFMEHDGHYLGLTHDIIEEAGKRAGIVVEFRPMPWRRLEYELTRGSASQVQCAFAMSHTAKRDEYLDFGKVPVGATDYVVFVREGSGIDTLDDLAGKTVGVRAGVRVADVLAEGVRTHRWALAEVGADEANFQKLRLKRVDAVVTDHSVGLYTLNQMKLKGIVRLLPPLLHYDTYMVFPKGAQSAPLAAAFDKALEQMRRDGAVERIQEKYLGGQRALP